MSTYLALNKQFFTTGNYSIVPIRMDDRHAIMQWRNEQIYHLRQTKQLTEAEQDNYFKTVVANLFHQPYPDQLLFSYLEGDQCIGYGGLVHINWTDQHAEISFLLNTALEKDYFEFHWLNWLQLIEEVAFKELGLHKLFTYAYDLRPALYTALEKASFTREATLKQHACFNGKFMDVVIHSKIHQSLFLRNAQPFDAPLTYRWATDPLIRQYAFSRETILWTEHLLWFTTKLTDPLCAYYILHDGGSSIGSVRFDLRADGIAMISYLVDPAFQGFGYGKVILEKGLERLKEQHPELTKTYGLVMNDNRASIKIFELLGFVKTEDKEGTLRFEKQL